MNSVKGIVKEETWRALRLGNIPEHWQTEDILQVFDRKGEVESIRFQGRFHAIVTYVEHAGAAKGIQLNSTCPMDAEEPVTVEIAHGQPEQ